MLEQKRWGSLIGGIGTFLRGVDLEVTFLLNLTSQPCPCHTPHQCGPILCFKVLRKLQCLNIQYTHMSRKLEVSKVDHRHANRTNLKVPSCLVQVEIKDATQLILHPLIQIMKILTWVGPGYLVTILVALSFQHHIRLDSLMFWMHHLQRQTAYSGSRNGHHPTPTSLNGGSQRGFIKIPSGIPQKHSRLWETQSTENMQLWATVTQLSATVVRAEAEMFCQRAKISKLEDDLQLMKVRQDAMSEALKGQTISPQAKRVRKKRNATAPVAILGLPACQPLPVKAQFKKARGLMNDQDASKASHTPSEGGSEETRLNSSLECINTCTLVTEGLDRKESLPNVPSNDKLEGQQGDNDHACTGDMVARQGSQDSCVRGSILVERTKEASGSENVEIKQECRNESTHDVDGCSEGAFFVERKEEACLIESIAAEDLHSGVSNADIEMTKMDESCIVEDRGLRKTASIGCRMTNESINMVREDNWLEGIGGSMEGGLLHGSGDFERPNAKNSWNEVHCAGQKVGMMVSGQQCDKRKNINEAMSEDWTVPNGSEYL